MNENYRNCNRSQSARTVYAFFRRRSVLLACAVLFSFGPLVCANAQTHIACATQKSLTLVQVVGLVSNKVPDSRIVLRIQSCNVAFSLDATAIDQLTAAGASDAVMDAVNRYSATELTLEQGHRQVAGLEAREAQIQSGGSLAHQNAALKPYQSRVELLKSMAYPISSDLVLGKYDASNQRLLAKIAGEDYQFDRLRPDDATILFRNPDKIKVMQLYSEDELRTRVLAIKGTGIAAAGSASVALAAVADRKRRAEIASRIDAAKKLVINHDYDRAAETYRQILQDDPNNSDAQAGLDEVLKIQARIKEFVDGLVAHGAWLDQATGLMWTIHESEQKMAWDEAPRYCSALQTAGVSNWRAPTANDFKGIYDEGAVKHAGHTKYFLKGGFALNHPDLWTSELSNELGHSAGMEFFPTNGEFHASFDWEKNYTVCVRKYQPATDGLDSLQASSTPARPSTGSQSAVAAVPLPSSVSATEIEKQAEALSHEKRYGDAFPLFKRACHSGNQDGCAFEGFSYMAGAGVTKDQARGEVTLSKACDAGSGMACAYLAGEFQFGIRRRRDFDRSLALYEKACDFNYQPGCSTAALFYVEGNALDSGIKPDREKANAFFAKACTLGDEDACSRGK